MKTTPVPEPAAESPVQGANPWSRQELEIAGEIAQAVLTASKPIEVYRLALVRVTPLVKARFASVFLRDPADPDLLKLACAQNWPQASARFLSRFRIRVGRGPTGRAVAESRAVEVTDVFADPGLREWWDPARELGFASLMSLPLRVGEEVVGALCFYFEEARPFGATERGLLDLVATQLSATAEKAYLIEELQLANARLERRNRQLTERVREAEEARRLKQEFLANISHELRTPLVSVLGYASLLAEGHAGGLSAEQAQAVSRIEHGANLLLRLIDDVLELVQLKLGRIRPRIERIDAAALAGRAVAAAGRLPDGVTLRFEPPESRVEVETDADKVSAILERLVGNAIKFTEAGEIVVEVRRESDREPGSAGGWRRAGGAADGEPGGLAGVRDAASGWVAWEVRDPGIGITDADLAIVFDEFRQVDGSSTRLYGGTGLGLALSLHLARLLGGDMYVRSEPGTGSSFLLRIPERAPSPNS